MTAGDYDTVCALILERSGITLGLGKRGMVYNRLVRRLRETGHNSFASYLRWLQGLSGPAAGDEWQTFVNQLTTNLTAFFREAHHFPLLATQLAARSPGPLRIWSSATSTGEEAYSIAITVADALGPQANCRILASDIDTRVLDIARKGIYRRDSPGLTAPILQRHFLRGDGENEGLIRVRPETARSVAFQALNLMDAHWALADAPFDHVFLRNVLIYFSVPNQRRVLEHVHRVLRPGGWLFAGHSENYTQWDDLFRLRGQSVYERV